MNNRRKFLSNALRFIVSDVIFVLDTISTIQKIPRFFHEFFFSHNVANIGVIHVKKLTRCDSDVMAFNNIISQPGMLDQSDYFFEQS